MKITVTDKVKRGQYTEVRFSEDISSARYATHGAKNIIEIPTPSIKECNNRKWIIFVRTIVAELTKHKIKKATIVWKNVTQCEELEGELGQLFAEAVMMAEYSFRQYKKKPKKGWPEIQEIVLIAPSRTHAQLKKQIRKGQVIASHVNLCRTWSNIPGGDMTPKMLVREAKKAIRGTKVRMKVLNEKQILQKKMGGVHAVGRGSAQESQFLILEYWGAASKKTKPTVLVGKGVTFDTGGIDTKPHPYGLEMMMDMSGGAAVINTLIVAAKLRLKKNIIALVPAVENMPGGNSFRPGDILRMMDGTTVEIGHTDAEGRLILADALTYAKQYKPKTVIDVATLTGAAVVALGEHATALYTRQDDFAQKALCAAEESGDYAWRMPLWEEYEAEMKGVHADLSNIGTGQRGSAGSITAAIFLHHFAKSFPQWMHLDMAPTMTSTRGEHLAKGAKGSPVRMLTKLLESSL